MAHAIESIKQRRQKIRGASGSQVAYGLVQRQPRAESLSTFQILRRRTQPSLIVKESRVVGFKEDAEVLMGQLLSQEEGRCIISIVGIEGTGKKTLARLIFDDEAVEDHFSCRVFVSVSPSWTVEKLLDEIATQSEINIMGGQQDTLRILATTKYLIVLDGIQFRTSHFLDTLTEAIPDMSTGSRILLTTRNASIVAPHAAARSFVHHLQLLDDENSWILFKRSLIVDIPLPPKLIEVGKKIVAKCGGLPSEILRTTTLLSRRDVTDEGWKEQLKQPNPVENPWAETLGTNLPLYLKRCLFYLELFPANFGIPVRRLVVLWVAEGLVQHGKHQEAPEQVAERYLTELIDLNMLQVAKRKPNGKVKTCRLPNSLRDLLVIKANELRFPQVSTSTDLNPTNSRIRQVADRFDEKDIWHKHIHVSNRNDSASLRNYYKDVLSFLSFDAREGSKPGQDISKFLNLCIWSNCLLLLRVLDLEGVHKPELPENISKLTLLRYLGLRWTYLQSLPSSIGNLLKLQTIDLKHTYIHTLTSSIWKMELRHLFLSETYRTRFPSKPKSAGDSLSDLQTLWGLFVDEGTPVKGDLDKLVNIKRLGIACQSMSLDENAMNSQLDAVADWILKLEKLKSLRLKSRDEKGQPWNLHLNSLQNHTDLTDLYLLGRLSGPSILSRFPPNLSELTLSHSKLEDDPMQILKDLENLRSLSLLAESYLGERLFCNSQSFPKLHVLKVWNLEQLEEWKIEKEALPSLIQLEIRACSRMTKLPEGLPHVNTLLELKLTNMPKQIDVDQTLLNCDVQRDN
uniref:Disease resistance RPP13-like protein 2 n=2 Tax=Cajanus cajan TaxID=3821 RepID=A0A151RWE6_CAJCA|nr:Putative disease resistance RPP13-like protein 2 [Cajanus cajan]